MVVKKFFLSFANEKIWLEKMNAEGYELMRVLPFRYDFEKTDREVAYAYAPLRRGRRTLFELKGRDAGASLVYANGEMSLFKKPALAGAPRLFNTVSEKKLAFYKYKSSLTTNSLVMLAGAAIFTLLGIRLALFPLFILTALFAAAFAFFSFQARGVEKYLKNDK